MDANRLKNSMLQIVTNDDVKHYGKLVNVDDTIGELTWTLHDKPNDKLMKIRSSDMKQVLVEVSDENEAPKFDTMEDGVTIDNRTFASMAPQNSKFVNQSRRFTHLNSCNQKRKEIEDRLLCVNLDSSQSVPCQSSIFKSADDFVNDPNVDFFQYYPTDFSRELPVYCVVVDETGESMEQIVSHLLKCHMVGVNYHSLPKARQIPYWISVQTDRCVFLFDSQNPAILCHLSSRLFADEKVLKVVYDARSLFQQLKPQGEPLPERKNFIDLMVLEATYRTLVLKGDQQRRCNTFKVLIEQYLKIKEPFPAIYIREDFLAEDMAAFGVRPPSDVIVNTMFKQCTYVLALYCELVRCLLVPVVRATDYRITTSTPRSDFNSKDVFYLPPIFSKIYDMPQFTDITVAHDMVTNKRPTNKFGSIAAVDQSKQSSTTFLSQNSFGNQQTRETITTLTNGIDSGADSGADLSEPVMNLQAGKKTTKFREDNVQTESGAYITSSADCVSTANSKEANDDYCMIPRHVNRVTNLYNVAESMSDCERSTETSTTPIQETVDKPVASRISGMGRGLRAYKPLISTTVSNFQDRQHYVQNKEVSQLTKISAVAQYGVGGSTIRTSKVASPSSCTDKNSYQTNLLKGQFDTKQLEPGSDPGDDDDEDAGSYLW